MSDKLLIDRAVLEQALKACEQRLPLKGQAAIIDELNNLRAALAQYQEQKDADYERGFLDGMQKQAESSVDRAVTRMALLAQERATPVKPAPPNLVGVVPITTVSVTTQHHVLTDADLDAIRKIVREGGKE